MTIPCKGCWDRLHGNRTHRSSRRRECPGLQLALPILAALTPPDVEISFTDDLLTPIDLQKGLKEADLVGVTVLTKTAFWAYQIADGYREKGVPVVLGGIHPSVLSEEAKGHADSVVIGEAEVMWSHLIEDVRTNDLKPFYSQEGYTDLSKIPRPRREILPTKGYFPVDVVQATPGCPFRCEFYSVRKFFGNTCRFRFIGFESLSGANLIQSKKYERSSGVSRDC